MTQRLSGRPALSQERNRLRRRYPGLLLDAEEPEALLRPYLLCLLDSGLIRRSRLLIWEGFIPSHLAGLDSGSLCRTVTLGLTLSNDLLMLILNRCVNTKYRTHDFIEARGVVLIDTTLVGEIIFSAILLGVETHLVVAL